jgi:hypothetical protein
MPEFRFEREARTPYSEQWSIDDGDHSIGRVDVHYTTSVTYATLAVHTSIDDETVQELISEIDDRVVTSADPYREDFIVTVWRGEELGVFAEDETVEDGVEAEAE